MYLPLKLAAPEALSRYPNYLAFSRITPFGAGVSLIRLIVPMAK
jgi:hypothetical protein